MRRQACPDDRLPRVSFLDGGERVLQKVRSRPQPSLPDAHARRRRGHLSQSSQRRDEAADRDAGRLFGPDDQPGNGDDREWSRESPVHGVPVHRRRVGFPEEHHIGRYGHRWYSYYCALEVLHKEHPENGSACAPDESRNAIESEFVELIQRQTFRELQARIGKQLGKSRFKNIVFTDLLRKILGTIYRAAIETISSPSHPTSNICLEVLMELRTVLQSEATAASSDLRKVNAHATVGGFIPGKDAGAVLQDAYDVLDKFLREAYLYLSIPAVLDPRFKMEYVSTILKKVFEKDDQPDYYISKVKETIKVTFGEHRRNLHSVNSGEGTSHITWQQLQAPAGNGY